MNPILGRGGESTLRIDEPLHFIFLVAYLITYFCCAYLLFICFKHCRRLFKRTEKQPRPATFDRLRNVAEAMNNLHCGSRGSGIQGLRNIQVSVGAFGRTHSEICPDSYGESRSQSQYGAISTPPSESDLDNETISSALVTPLPSRSSRRTRSEDISVTFTYLTIEHDLPDYDTVSQSEVEQDLQESPPPSYAECIQVAVSLDIDCEDLSDKVAGNA